MAVSIRASVADDYLDKTNNETFYIDINSEQLQEILKKVLQGVKGICLDGEELIAGVVVFVLLACYPFTGILRLAV
jgi:hypothetical protein